MSELAAMMKDVATATEGFSAENKQALNRLLGTLTGKVEQQTTVFRQLRDYYRQTARCEMDAQLDAAEARTHKGADGIMSAAEKLMQVLGAAKLPEAQSQAAMEQVNAIFEACAFQDLVSQHLHEVKLLTAALDEAFDADTDPAKAANLAKRVKDRDARPDRELLNGPSTQV